MPPLTPRDIVAAKLNQIATLKAALNEATAPFHTQIESIRAACDTVTRSNRSEIETLVAEVEKLAATHAADIFTGKARAFEHNGHRVTRSEGKAVDCDDESAVIELALDLAETGEDDGTKMSAAACVKTKHSLDKSWVRSKWAKHGDWFAQMLGLRLKTTTTFCVEIDGEPALPKAKKGKGRKVETTQEETTEEPA